jgi:hypothetical protein
LLVFFWSPPSPCLINLQVPSAPFNFGVFHSPTLVGSSW